MITQQVFVDPKGYLRNKFGLIHRQVAYSEIYLKNRKDYPLRFSCYVIHHRDFNKKNNAPENLEILERKEHNEILEAFNFIVDQAIHEAEQEREECDPTIYD